MTQLLARHTNRRLMRDDFLLRDMAPSMRVGLARISRILRVGRGVGWGVPAANCSPWQHRTTATPASCWPAAPAAAT